jgi:hypothetical protein
MNHIVSKGNVMQTFSGHFEVNILNYVNTMLMLTIFIKYIGNYVPTAKFNALTLKFHLNF